ncbi:MAG: amidase [Burkholderiales bacterium]|nr:amidase [Burkholderiales bacterium]
MKGDVAFLPAGRLAAMIHRREVGCLELLEHYLARVERFNPALNAIVVTDVPGARERARAADRALAAGEAWGPLHGVPMTVKDAFDVKGLPTTFGVPALKDNIARGNALAVERWLAAGAVIFGKTNVPLWLADAQTFNAIYGTTNNPWNPALTPGGSSGGGSAALAAGLTGIEMGSDIASSIRNPAALCGVFGHKPTYGICPPRGHAQRAEDVAPLDILCIGPLGRSAEDVALGLRIMAGPDAIAERGLRLALPAPAKKRLRDFKVGIIIDDPFAPVERDMVEQLQRLADFLAQQGAQVSDKARPDIDLDHASRTFDLLLRSATSAGLSDDEQAQFRQRLAALPPDADTKLARMLRGNTLSHRDWLRLDEARQRMRWKWHEFFGAHDLLLGPVICTAAYPHDHTPPYERVVNVNGEPRAFHSLLFWAGYTGMAYLPSTVAPIGFTRDGRPVGVQIAGPEFGDRSCLHFARLLEKEYQGFVPPPGFE